MYRAIKVGLTLLVGVTLGTSSLVPANAATWHKGTPKALRHSFITKGGGMKDNWTSFSGNKKGFTVGHMGMPGIIVSHSKYRHTGRTYILKGHAKKNGIFNGGNVTYKMTKSGSHFILSGGYTHAVLHRQ